MVQFFYAPFLSRGGHPLVPGNIQTWADPYYPERAVSSLLLEHGECRDEHFVDDMYNPVVCIHVRPDHLATIDLDAFSYCGGHGVSCDKVKRIAAGSDVLLSQRNLRNVRPYSEPLPLERFEEEAVKQVVRRIISRHDVILEHPGQFFRIIEQVGLLIVGQAVKGGIDGNEDGEGAWPAEGLDEPGNGLYSLYELVV